MDLFARAHMKKVKRTGTSRFSELENRKEDVEALLRAWRFLEKKTDYVFLAGDFNCVDKHAPQLWDKFLMQFQCSDVHPELATYRHSKGVSCLDRVLIPDSLVNSAKLFASASVITSHVANGHDIVKARVSVKPQVVCLCLGKMERLLRLTLSCRA